MTEFNLPDRVVRVLRQARRVAVVTGAGMSAESGVPTFRGDGGVWRSFRPEDLATPEAFNRDPVTVWAWYRWRQHLIARATPNAGHVALARLEVVRPGWQVLTQNVDGLHHRAGSEAVVELHGSIWRSRCVSCHTSRAIGPDHIEDEAAPVPRCTCGEMLRPAVVWFGESLDPAVVAQAWSAVEEADALIVIGTSAVVYPVAALPDVARAKRVPVVEINVDDTPLTARADFVVRATAATALSALESAL